MMSIMPIIWISKVRKMKKGIICILIICIFAFFFYFTHNNCDKFEKLGYGDLPVCIAKTQYSFSDDAKNLECQEPFEINVRDVELKAGAEFIVVFAGKIMTMPGLPKVPAAETIDIDENGEIVGIF